MTAKTELRRISHDDSAALDSIRAFVREELLGRAVMHACVEQSELLAHVTIWAAYQNDRLVGATTVLAHVESEPVVAIAARLPGVATALVEKLPRPSVLVPAVRLAAEVERAGAAHLRDELQMARLQRKTLPAIEHEVVTLTDSEAMAELAGPHFSPLYMKLGPFYGVMDPSGAVVAMGGVQFVTGDLARIAHIHTREDRRRQGLARSIVCRLIETLEAERRRIILRLRMENVEARELYAGLGFRGTRRVDSYHLE